MRTSSFVKLPTPNRHPRESGGHSIAVRAPGFAGMTEKTRPHITSVWPRTSRQRRGPHLVRLSKVADLAGPRLFDDEVGNLSRLRADRECQLGKHCSVGPGLRDLRAQSLRVTIVRLDRRNSKPEAHRYLPLDI